MNNINCNFNEDCPETTIRCGCGCGQRLVVTKYKDEEDDYEDYEIDFQTDCTEKGLTFFRRIVIAFKFMRGQTHLLAGLILNRNDIKKLSEDLLELLEK